jgi:phenylalanyl-tRNA synthetase beta chain
MKVSRNSLQSYLSFKLPSIANLSSKIGLQLGALEEVPTKIADAYQGIYIVKVKTVTKIEGSDHLSACKIDDNLANDSTHLIRDENGFVDVVCGAPNVRPGIITVWIAPGSIVPVTYQKDNFRLSSRKFLDHISNGMLASAQELNLGDDHQGIVDIKDSQIKIGQSLISYLKLDDYILDIENKMFTHRPDCFGLIGVAREVSGIYNHPFKSPSWYRLHPKNPKITQQISYNLKLRSNNPELVPRICGVVLKDVEVKKSPLKLQSYLIRMGIKPINNIVDVTNLVMLETGQPLHAYDLSKLIKPDFREIELVARKSRAGETIELLNSKEYKLDDNKIVIEVNNQVAGLAGIMGGRASQISPETNTILLESANFNMYSIRRTSMELGLMSEAVTRFTKGQSAPQTELALKRAMAKILELSPNVKQGSELIDTQLVPNGSPSITVSLPKINKLLGLSLSLEVCAQMLQNVEIETTIKKDGLVVKSPFWRTDLVDPEDIIEEIGRLHGYQNIKDQKIIRPIIAIKSDPLLKLQGKLRSILARTGSNEVLNYSFIGDTVVKNFNLNPKNLYCLNNSLSPQLKYFRSSISASLLQNVHPNLRNGYNHFELFEIGKTHINGLIHNDRPNPFSNLGFIYVDAKKDQNRNGASFFKAKAYLEYLMQSLRREVLSYQPIVSNQKLSPELEQIMMSFDPSRSALIKAGKQTIGIVGEYRVEVLSKLKVAPYSAGFEILLDKILDLPTLNPYREKSKYPVLKLDLTYKVPNELNYSIIRQLIKTELKRRISESQYYQLKLDYIYQAPNNTSDLNYTFHLRFFDKEKTLNDQEVNRLIKELDLALNKNHKIERI